MPKYLMQAVSSGVGGDGALKSWPSPTPDFGASGFPGPGTAAHTAIAKVIRDDLLVTTGAGSGAGDRVEWNGTAWEKRRGWITPSIDLTGVVDAKAAIEAAAAQRPGACIYIPDGVVKLSSPLTLPAGCTLTGEDRGMRAGHRVFVTPYPVGTRFDIHHTGKAFILTNQETACFDFEVYYPNQQINATPDVYDYTFDVTGIGCEISNITCINPYQFIKVAANGARLDNLYAFPLATGLYLARCPDVVRSTNIHFNPIANHESGATLLAWVQANQSAFVIDGPEAANFTNCFAYGGGVGIRCVDADADGFKGASANFVGGGLDLFGACVRVDPAHGLSLTGLNVSACSFVTTQGGNGVLFLDTDVPASDVEKPGVWLSQVHGNAAGTGMARMIWMPSDSYGHCFMSEGVVLNVTNEVARGDGSHSNIVRLRDVGSQSGDTRTAGTVSDLNGWTV